MGFLAASACAEVIADVMLCPMEAVSFFLFLDNNIINSSKLECKHLIEAHSQHLSLKDLVRSIKLRV